MSSVEDSDDLGISIDEEVDDFSKATAFVRSCPGSFSDNDLLYFYARYKQALDGDCNTPKPGFFDFAGKKKWEAWNGLKGKSKESAKAEYFEKLSQLKPDWMPKDGSIPKGGGGMQLKVSRMAYVEDDEEANPKTACGFVKSENLDALKACISSNPNACNLPDAEDNTKMTPLHWACDRGNDKAVEFLLSLPETDVNLLDNYGQTALHYAASCDQLKCAELLLKHPKIKISIEDEDGSSPASVCASKEMKELFQKFS